MERQHLTIAATFTAEPVEEPLRFWMEKLATRAVIEFAPYNQVFQQLLDLDSLFARNQAGVNVILLRLEDWLGQGGPGTRGESDNRNAPDNVRRTVEDFVSALRRALLRFKVPCLVCCCPPTPGNLTDQKWVEFVRTTEEWLATQFAQGQVQILTHMDLASLYPVEKYHDPEGEEIGHVPYTSLFFACLGTLVARKTYSLLSRPYKVIAVDCDDTLWKGVCGEDGPHGVVLDAPRQALQEFLLDQQQAGMLLCLCSKNNEQDVLDVFAQRPDMPLQTHHFVTWRINWERKSRNLDALADELQLGLDSFVFLDDSPVECAEVRASFPEVLVLTLPRAAEQIPHFLQHVWAFDRARGTAEDRNRTISSRQNLERERVRSRCLTLGDFLAGLDLRVQIREPKPEDLGRIAQLTERTNQFNVAGLRRSASELRSLMFEGSQHCRVVEVSDRFGDYGLVGVLIYCDNHLSLDVDTFLLSCRALGRGVEHQMLRELGRVALEAGRSWINIRFVPTGRNQPARTFLERAGGKPETRGEGQLIFRFPADQASATSLEHDEKSAAHPGRNQADHPVQLATTAEVLGRIASEWNDPERIMQSLTLERRAAKQGPHASGHLQGEIVAPRTPVEQMVASIWEELLGLENLDIRSDFFDVGGDSLLATRLVARLRDTFQIPVSLEQVFKARTIERLALAILEDLAVRSGVAELDAP
jgi:FkbH-like protein